MQIKIGDIFPCKAGTSCQVIEYINSSHIKVKWLDSSGYEMLTQSARLKTGKLKSPFTPTVMGVGYLGVGDYKVKKEGVLTKEYMLWNSILNRCYNPKVLAVRSTYTDKRVCESWHNFQTFADWAVSQNGFGTVGWHLDKDLLLKGNKVYSPETCCFVPSEVNAALTNNKACRGEFPIGVCFDENSGKFQASCNNGTRQVNLGRFSTPEKAFAVYKAAKEQNLRELAHLYRNEISTSAHYALVNYTVEVTD